MTTSQPAPFAGNLADSRDMYGVMRFIVKKIMQQTDDMLPARVISYDRAANRAKVQPLVSIISTGNQRINRAPVASVPVLQLGGGGFVLSFPIQAGDLGWIKANDADISSFLDVYGIASPTTQRSKTFEDALFIPDQMLRNVTINAEDENAVVLQSIDGSVKISLAPNKLTIKAPEVKIDTPLLTISDGTGVVNIAGINFLTHRHRDVQAGSGNSGYPIA